VNYEIKRVHESATRALHFVRSEFIESNWRFRSVTISTIVMIGNYTYPDSTNNCDVIICQLLGYIEQYAGQLLAAALWRRL